MNYFITDEQLSTLKSVINCNDELIASTLSNIYNQVDCVQEPKNGIKPIEMAEYLMNLLRCQEQENFAVLFLNNAGKIIKSEILFKGTYNASLVDIPFILRKAILINSNSIIISHNHPSGNVSPSSQDVQLTNKIKRSCELMGIKLLDHIIVSNTNYYSFVEHNSL